MKVGSSVKRIDELQILLQHHADADIADVKKGDDTSESFGQCKEDR